VIQGLSIVKEYELPDCETLWKLLEFRTLELLPTQVHQAFLGSLIWSYGMAQKGTLKLKYRPNSQ
jgi:hypothetical protein